VSLGRPLADLIGPGISPLEVISWKQVPSKAVRWLDRLFQKAGIEASEVRDEIPFSVFFKIYEFDLRDAKGIGPVSQHLLISILTTLYETSGYQTSGTKVFSDVSALAALDSLDFNEEHLPVSFDEQLHAAPSTLLGLLEHYLARVQIHFDLEERIEMVRMRSALFSDEPATLQEIGDEFGISRERIRQILRNVDKYVISEFDSIPILDKVTEIAASSKDVVEFEKTCTFCVETNYQAISLSRLMAICRAYNRVDLVERISQVNKTWVAELNNEVELTSKLRSIRGNSGLIDIHLFAGSNSLTPEDAIRLIVSTYPRTLFFDRYCLTRTLRTNPVTETTVYLLLKTFPGISIENLLVGIRRRSRRRGDEITIPDAALVQLIYKLAGNPPTAEGMEKGLLEKPKLDTHDRWLVQTLSATDKKFLHASEILIAAINDGLNLGSMSSYFSTSAFVYPPIPHSGVYALLDQNPSEYEVRSHRSIALAMQPENWYQHNFDNGKLIVEMRLNVQTAAGGSLTPPAELLEIVKGLEFSIGCECGGLVTDQILKVKNTFWFSLSPVIRHLLEIGIYRINSTIKITIDFDLKTALLSH
jgi:hypothetical protein